MLTVRLILSSGTIVETDLEAGAAITYVDRMIRLQTGGSDIPILQPNGESLIVKAAELLKVEVKF